MADIYSREKRSEIMSHIRSAGLKPEQKLYTIIRDVIGHRWRIDCNDTGLPGKPDIVIPSLALALFADGCFFHSCPLHGHIPKSNQQYWKPKLDANRRRDMSNARHLRKLGYAVWRIWEHDLKGQRAKVTAKRLTLRLNSRIVMLHEGRIGNVKRTRSSS